MKKKLFYVLSSLLILTACGVSNNSSTTNEEKSSNSSINASNSSINDNSSFVTNNSSTSTSLTENVSSTAIGQSSSLNSNSQNLPISSQTPIETNGEIKVLKAKGNEEAFEIEFEKLNGVSSYTVMYAEENSNSYKEVDGMLIREYSSKIRVDCLGLKPGKYNVKIYANSNNQIVESTLTTIQGLNVSSICRDGFAFDGSIPGAYNLDGTLKKDAIVLYITNENKDAISIDVTTSSKGTKTKCTGLQEIIYGFKKGNDHRPLCIRVIGNITDLATLDKGDLVLDGGKKYSAGLTLEGVGEDAVLNGFGVRVKGAKNIEIRNLGFMNCDSEEGDSIGLQQDNQYVFVHHNDVFYGNAGSDADQAKGDGAADTKGTQFVTYAYNHFWDTGKTHLNGNGDNVNKVTYHHNWYDHSDSRHPRVRISDSIHVYNNYFDGVSKYGIGATMGSSIFSESNYYRNTKYPILSSLQGSDFLSGDGVFSGENGGIVKSYNDIMTGNYKFIPHTDNNSAGFDAYVATSRDEKVAESYKTKTGGTTYSNFDTASTMYKYEVTPVENVIDVVEANAGRLNKGDFSYEFNDASEDRNYNVISDLKQKITNYKSTVTKIGLGSNPLWSIGANSSQGGSQDTPITSSSSQSISSERPGSEINVSISHNFTTQGLNSQFFTISGNLSKSKGSVTYLGMNLTTCLKMESATSIKFSISKSMKITLVFLSTDTGKVKIDGTKYPLSSGLVEMVLDAGEHTITKGDSMNLFYISLN